MGDRSIQVWVVEEYGHEYSTPVKVWDSKKRAEQHVKRLTETLNERGARPPDFLGYRTVRVPMILSWDVAR